MSDEYIISDLHLCHTNIIKYAERTDYELTNKSTERMNWNIVNSINKQIPDEEGVVLWNLGDLFYGKLFSEKSLQQLKNYISVMKGKNRTLNIVLGNHDKQFKRFADWKNLTPLTKNSSFTEIFTELGFTNVYDKPIIWKENYILSHEPVFLKKNSQFINIHGHVHQMPVDESYFTWDLENYKMVRKAYKDSGREVPPLQHKENWEQFVVDPKMYKNACWDFTKGKVLEL